MEVREYPLPEPGSRSRRLVVTSDDMVWFVNSGLGRLGRLNPETGEIKEWRVAERSADAPVAIEVIDDVIWYNESDQRPDALVRFDPKTESFRSSAVPLASASSATCGRRRTATSPSIRPAPTGSAWRSSARPAAPRSANAKVVGRSFSSAIEAHEAAPKSRATDLRSLA